MTIQAGTRRATLAEFEALPEGPPNFEYDEGEIVPVPSPTVQHQDIVSELDSAMRRYVRAHATGRVFTGVDVYLPDGRVYIPDLGFLSNERLDCISPLDGKVHGTPDLVVEVTSTDEARDRAHKFHVYYENGVPWLWLVSQQLLVEEYRATPEGYARASTAAPGDGFYPALFPGLSINLAALLAPAAPQDAEPPADQPEPA